MDRGDWRTTIYEVTKSQTQLRDQHTYRLLAQLDSYSPHLQLENQPRPLRTIVKCQPPDEKEVELSMHFFFPVLQKR